MRYFRVIQIELSNRTKKSGIVMQMIVEAKRWMGQSGRVLRGRGWNSGDTQHLRLGENFEGVGRGTKETKKDRWWPRI